MTDGVILLMQGGPVFLSRLASDCMQIWSKARC